MAIVAPLIKANRHYAMVLILEEQKHRVHTSRCEDAKRWRLHGTAAAAAPVKRLTQSGATIVYSHQPCNSQFSSKLESRLVGVWTELWRLLLSWFFSLSFSEPTNLSRLFYTDWSLHTVALSKLSLCTEILKFLKFVCVCVYLFCVQTNWLVNFFVSSHTI